jgi:hypothetical protein
MSENDPDTSIPEALCAAIDLLEEIDDIRIKLDALVEAGWQAHEYDEDLPAMFEADLRGVLDAYVDAVRRAS